MSHGVNDTSRHGKLGFGMTTCKTEGSVFRKYGGKVAITSGGFFRTERIRKQSSIYTLKIFLDTMTPWVMATWMKKAILYMSWVDDVINVAGYRISAGAVEESVLSHGTVAACAVVGKEDLLKGHVPLALCVLRKGLDTTEEQVLEEL